MFAGKTDSTDREERLAEQIAAVAQRQGTTDEAIALAWLLRHPAGIQPILGTSKIDRIGNSVRADEINLTRTDWYTLLETARGEPVP